MPTNPVIEVSGLGKKFARSLKRGMVYGLADIARAALIPHRMRSPGFEARISDAARPSSPAAAFDPAGADSPRDVDGLRPTEFWALRNLNFAVQRGECVGVVGHNGAGKSTLFSILSGIYGPTEGRAVIRGRLQALIALGAGFHPNLTGRENIYVNGAILGLREKEISNLLPRIIEFSEIPEFMDAPVRTYSSGMVVRLGFSVAAHLNPDILLVDEVLAVGDSRFQSKCQDHMRKIMSSGVAVVLVSHYMQNIQGMCTRALWLNHGRLMMDGDVQQVTTAYQRHLYSSGSLSRARDKESIGGFSAYIEDVRVFDENGADVRELRSGAGVAVEVTLVSSSEYACGRVYVMLQSQTDTTCVLAASMLEEGWGVRVHAGVNKFRVRFPSLPLREGPYMFYACMRSRDGVIAYSNGCLSKPFFVSGPPREPGGALPVIKGRGNGYLEVPSQWQIEDDRKVRA